MDVDIGGGCPYVGADSTWEIFVFYAQFFCDPKNVLKIKFINKVYK